MIKKIDEPANMPTTDYYSQEILKSARTTGKYTEVMKSLTKCPFCDLKSKYFVYEEADVVLTMNLFPYIDGHMLIIPKRHVESFEDLKDKEWKQVKKLIIRGKAVIRDYFNIPGVNFLYRQGLSSGISLGHVHFHLIPTPKIILNPDYQEIKFAPVDLAKVFRKTLK